jgi:hypothetical protein
MRERNERVIASCENSPKMPKLITFLNFWWFSFFWIPKIVNNRHNEKSMVTFNVFKCSSSKDPDSQNSRQNHEVRENLPTLINRESTQLMCCRVDSGTESLQTIELKFWKFRDYRFFSRRRHAPNSGTRGIQPLALTAKITDKIQNMTLWKYELIRNVTEQDNDSEWRLRRFCCCPSE